MAAFKIVISALDKTDSVLGKVRRNLGAVGASVNKLKRRFPNLSAVAGGAFRKIRGAVGSLVKAFSVLSIAGAGIFTLLVRSSLIATDNLAKTARKIGTTTDALAKMRYAADLTGVSATTMDMALQRFTRRTAEAAKGTGEAKGALRELNIDAKEMLKLPLDEQMLELSSAFEKVKNPADKVRLAMKLFDSEGVALVNTLGLGKQALQEMMGEAAALGITLSSEAAAGVEEANDSFTRLNTLLKGFRDQTVAKLAPALQAVIDKLVLFGQEVAGGDFENIGAVIANKIVDGFKSLITVFENILNTIGVVFHQIKQMYSRIFTSEETKKNEAELERLKKAAQRAGISLNKALDPNDSYGERLSEANRKIVTDFMRVQERLRQTELEQAEPYKPFDFSELLKELGEVQDKMNSTAETVEKVGNTKINIKPVSKAREAFKSWSDSIEPIDKQLHDISVNAMDGFTDSVAGAITGATSFKEAIRGMAKGVIDALTKMLVQYYIAKPLFDLITGMIGGGSASGSTTATASTTGASVTEITGQSFGSTVEMPQLDLGSFDGGGFTGSGNRTGGVDGKGGFPAILHPNETVIDHMKQSGRVEKSSAVAPKPVGDTIIVNQSINLTTGIQSTVRAEIQNMMPQINESTKAAVAEARARGGSYSRALLGA